MKKKIIIFSALASIVTGTAAINFTELSPAKESSFLVRALEAPKDADQYDYWLNTWSKPNHLYVHYNRGTKAEYDKYCLWLWNDKTDTDGTLWAYGGQTHYTTVTMSPMTTHWMYDSDIKDGEESQVYCDDYGVIADIDLSDPNLHEGKVKAGGTPGKANYDKCTNLGFLFPLISSMNGDSHWTSDGSKDRNLVDWRDEKNWRDVNGGKACHVFLATGALDSPTYYAGSGTPKPLYNIIDTDESGKYSSKVQNITDTYGVSKTSESFKELGVGYQVFVSSFRDSNGDGYGDLRGVIDSLDYLKDLGVDVLWLTPIQKSGSYHGYDIIDYYAVDERFGTVDDYRELIYKAHEKGMKVLMDLVLNHTSKNNKWFEKSEWGVNSYAGSPTDDTGIKWRDVYTWKYKTDKIERAKRTADGKDIKLPVEYEEITVEEDARSLTGASWYKCGESNYYYYGKFGSDMPEINYENKDTRKLVQDMAKYWLSFGLDGFRLDAVKHIYMKDEVSKESSKNDIIMVDVGTQTAYDEQLCKDIYKPYDYSSDLTKNIAFWKEFSNELKKVYPNCFLVGENFDGYGARTAGYYQGLDSQFDFSNYYHIPSFLFEGYGAGQYASVQAGETFDAFAAQADQQITVKVGEQETKVNVPGGKRSDFINGSFTSNHDVPRAINQANGVGDFHETVASTKVTGTATELGKAKIQAAVTLLSPGISWIYYGDELGMSSNTDQHIALYDNDNCVDTWYRQPFIWQGAKGDKVRPNYQNGKYQFNKESYDSWNASLAANNKGVVIGEDGKFTCNNEMYTYYKGLTALKGLYPKGAKVQFDNSSSENILVLNVTGQGKGLKIYINTGYNSNQYLVNPEGYNETPVAQINCSGIVRGANIGGNAYSVVAFQAK